MTDWLWMDWNEATAYDKQMYIAKHYGLAHQEKKLAEECIELANAILHGDEDGIEEEMVDVQNMLDQVFELKGCTNYIPMLTKKLNRQLQRIEKEEQERMERRLP